MLLTKIVGGILIFVGLAFIFVFPTSSRYQPEGFTKLAIIIGMFLILLGIYFVVA